MPRRSTYWAGLVLLSTAVIVMFVALTVRFFHRDDALVLPPATAAEPPAAEAPSDREGSAAAPQSDQTPSAKPKQAEDSVEQEAAHKRHRMVDRQLRARDIVDRRVLAAMGRVPRHRFVPEAIRQDAYADTPLPIGHGQTISQPYIVALMTQLVEPEATDRALDVGTGSGYQAAVLAELVEKVYGIEIVKPLANEARRRLNSLGYENIEVRHGDGYRGWKEHAPFDLIIVAAAPDHVPQPLVEQLSPSGKLVIPVEGRYWQNLLVIEKRADGTVQQRKVAPVAFVPMTGEAREETRLKQTE